MKVNRMKNAYIDRDANKTYNQNIYIIIIMLLYLLSLLKLTQHSILSNLGLLSALSLILIFGIYFIKNIDHIRASKIWFAFSLLCIYIICRYITYFKIVGLEDVLHFMGLILIATLFSTVTLSASQFNYISKKCIYVFYISNIIMVFYFYGIIYVSITLWRITFALSFFALLNVKKKFIFAILLTVFYTVFGERAAALAIIFIYIVYIILGLIKNKRIYYLIYWVSALGMSLFSVFYVWLYAHPLGNMLNEMSRKYTDANFFSGRHKLWDIIFNEISGKELFGVGFSNSILIDNYITLSTHNLYMYLIMCGGYALLFLFLLFMFMIWMKYYEYLDNVVVRLSAAYMLGIMFLVGFDLLLVKNNLIVSLYMWLIIGIGMMVGNAYAKI